MAATRAPKQWSLTKIETVNSYENWRQNIIYTLSLDANFAPFLADGATWQKKGGANQHRGFTNDDDAVPAGQRRTAVQKATMLDLMLGQIANYCPIISRNTIVKNSTSLGTVWQAIRSHFGFQATGAHFIDFADMKLEVDERPEDLYQRIIAFTEDSLLRTDGNITHHGIAPDNDEELTATLENFLVLTWLRLIHVDLPRLVKQRYGTELRTRTLASIKPEISQALEQLLDEVRTAADVKVLRSAPATFPRSQRTSRFSTNQSKFPHNRVPPKNAKDVRPTPKCPLCHQAGRYDEHFLSKCKFLPEHDKRFMARARQVVCDDFSDDDLVEQDIDMPPIISHIHTKSQDCVANITHESSCSRRVQVKRSPSMEYFSNHNAVQITLDSGAEINMIKASIAKYIGAKITKSSQIAYQADGRSALDVTGETRITLTRDDKIFVFEGLVVGELDVDILGGVPFLSLNDITLRPAKHQIILSDNTVYTYGNKSALSTSGPHAVRRAQSHLVRAPPRLTTIWPGEYVEVDLPQDLYQEDILSLEPRMDSHITRSCSSTQPWPAPDMVSNVGGKVRIPNMSQEPKMLRKGEHFCQVHSVFVPPTNNVNNTNIPPKIPSPQKTLNTYHSATVQIDPDGVLSPALQTKFQSILVEYDTVFDKELNGYNGCYGPYQAVVNMGSVQPPQRKGRIPQYSRDKLVELQEKFDALELTGVFQRPETIGVVVEYLNPSFLIKKPNGGYRLVTAFADVGRYSKPQPALMPDVDSTLRSIAQWRYIIVTDLTSAFYQIPLSKESMKYCGVVTPFRGIRVYTRSAMGMPGSETALEELMSRILGDLVQDGVVAKLADDLYCGGNTPGELLINWTKVLKAFHKCGMKLSPSKTIIAPRTTTILGWIWSAGQIHASPHRIATLSSCALPTTVRGLRSFIGAYKVLARVIPHCANVVAPLDDFIAGRQSSDKLSWTNDTQSAFKYAQKSLSTNETITLPRPSDVLWIVTDGAVKSRGIGATLYVVRAGKPRLAGFFSAKLRKQQVTWIPCEIEALSIATAMKHFSPYSIQSEHKTCILTDSKPCVQAFEKLCRGEFSASPRVSTFLATVSRYQASIQHIAGIANIPADFASRNAPECDNINCQICTFIRHTEDSVVRHVSTQDILSGSSYLPFTSRNAWLATQSECQDLRRTHAHLSQGTRPSRKLTNIKDIKRYLHVASIAKDGLLVVRQSDALAPMRETIIIPRSVLDGLIMALHIKLNHPSTNQLKLVFRRFFYALDMDKSIDQVARSCHQCAALKAIPHTVVPQDTTDPPDAIGVSYAADVIKRERQFIVVVRETVTSFTAAQLVDNERHESLRAALVNLCIPLRPLDGPVAVIRTDPAPGFRALVNDKFLHQQRLAIEIGRVKNINKNPVAERAVQEVEHELLQLEPVGGPVSPLQLSIAISLLNTRIRSRGMSAREMWTQRDQFTNDQLPVVDRNLIMNQHRQRLSNHLSSERAKAPLGKTNIATMVDVGDLVYLYVDGHKGRARDRYLVVSVDGSWCNIRKFTGSQLRSTSYRVKQSECYKVQSAICNEYPSYTAQQDISDDEYTSVSQPSPDPSDIPHEISEPLDWEEPISTVTESIPCDITQPSSSPPQPVETNKNVHISPDTTSISHNIPLDRPKRAHRRPTFLNDYVQ